MKLRWHSKGKVLLGLLLCLGSFGSQTQAQSKRLSAAQLAELLPSPGILRNSIANLHAQGDSLWVGPFLNLTTDGGATWQVADADSLAGLRNRVYSFDVEGEVIWAGVGISQSREIDGQTQEVDIARGLLVSEDGGRTWSYRTYARHLTQ